MEKKSGKVDESTEFKGKKIPSDFFKKKRTQEQRDRLAAQGKVFPQTDDGNFNGENKKD